MDEKEEERLGRVNHGRVIVRLYRPFRHVLCQRSRVASGNLDTDFSILLQP